MISDFSICMTVPFSKSIRERENLRQKFADFREAREALLLAYEEKFITAEKYFLLNDLSASKNLAFPYWQHGSFELDLLTDVEYKSEFILYRNDIYKLAKVLITPDQIICYHRSKLDGIEAFYIILKKFVYPCWYSDIIQRCGRSVAEVPVFFCFFVFFFTKWYPFKNCEKCFLFCLKSSFYSREI